MQEMDDTSLLREYVERNSEEAFAELVARHVNKVYSVALRLTRDPHSAEEVAQLVFVVLARKARKLGQGVILSGWLYETARLTAINATRSELRRIRREQEAQMLDMANETEAPAWPQIAPLLELAMAGLREADRHAVVLRFFDGCSMGEVGAAMGTSEEAAKKRVNRAVEKLREFFTRKGVVVPATALMAAISAHSVQAAPAGLAKVISSAAIAQGAAGAGIVATAIQLIWKPLIGSFAGLFVAPMLSGFFHLKAEVEHARSPRERQFLVRMIWLRFGLAFGMLAIAGLAMMIPGAREPSVIVYGYAGLCFVGAIGSGYRLIYFHRRRRQIQIEDGTWQEYAAEKTTSPAELLTGLTDQSSKETRNAARSAVFGLLGCLITSTVLVMRMVSGGHWVAAALVLLWGAWAAYRWCSQWRQMSRFVFDASLITPVKVVLCFGLLTLLFFDLSWANGRLPQSRDWAIGFNVAVVVAYGGLARLFGRAQQCPLTGAQHPRAHD